MKIYYYVDEGGSLDLSDKSIFVIGCSVIQDKKRVVDQIMKKENYIRDTLQFNRSDFHTFHASVDSGDIYEEFVRLLRNIPFRSYLVFTKIKNKDMDKKREIYIKMVGKLFSNLFLEYKNDDINIFFEQNGIFKKTTSKQKFTEELLSISRKIGKDIKFNVSIIEKEERLLSITDYVNHIFIKAYNKDKKPFMIRNYNLIKDKIGMIYDIDKNIYYNSKKRLIIREDR